MLQSKTKLTFVRSIPDPTMGNPSSSISTTLLRFNYHRHRFLRVKCLKRVSSAHQTHRCENTSSRDYTAVLPRSEHNKSSQTVLNLIKVFCVTNKTKE